MSSIPFTTGFPIGSGPPLSRIDMLTRVARVSGFDAVWTVDHFLGFVPQSIWDEDFSWVADPSGTPHAFFDYQALLGHVAGKAGSMQVAVGVTEPIRRHPVLLAQHALTLSHIAKKPPILGIGAGERENTEPYGLEFTKIVSRLEEALQIITLCFDSRGPFEFRGQFFDIPDAVMDLAPAKGRRPELWIAAHGPRMLDLTGRFGDGWWPVLPYTPESYAESLDAVRRSAVAAGRDPDRITPGWSVFTLLAETEADARKQLDAKSSKFTALMAPWYVWDRFGVEHPLGERFGGLVDFVPQRYERAEIEAAIAAVPLDLLAEAVVWGTPEQVENRMREFIDAGVRHLMLQPASALISKKDALYSIRQVVKISRSLKRWAKGRP